MKILLLRLWLVINILGFIPGMFICFVLWIPLYLFNGTDIMDKYFTFIIDNLGRDINNKIDDIRENKKKKKEQKKISLCGCG